MKPPYTLVIYMPAISLKAFETFNGFVYLTYFRAAIWKYRLEGCKMAKNYLKSSNLTTI